MNFRQEWKPLLWITGAFILLYFLPIGNERFDNAIIEALYLTKWYAREHVLLCLVPAFFIAGAIAVFVSQESVMKYLGPSANKILAYSVSSVSGSILAVCSCTVLPLFAGIYRMGAGLGPASTFLYSGPAINILAIILTLRVLGPEIGIARAIGAILFSIIIGLFMHLFYRKEEMNKSESLVHMPEPVDSRPIWQTVIYFGLMIAILVVSNWGRPSDETGFWRLIYSSKWIITSVLALIFSIILVKWFSLKWWKMLITSILVIAAAIPFADTPQIPFTIGVIGLSIITGTDKGENSDWFEQTWGFAKQILPLLLIGVILAGFFLGRPDHKGIIPSEWISAALGGNSIWANLFASISGAFMYFATLTEVPILEGLIGNGMGKGPALTLLLSGPALSLPNMLVIRSVIGTKKTLVFILLVVIMATISGMIFGALF
ncbi:MAG: permease [Spirochaetota bacterium]|nr:permease [Spirochaetota bacterium]